MRYFVSDHTCAHGLRDADQRGIEDERRRVRLRLRTRFALSGEGKGRAEGVQNLNVLSGLIFLDPRTKSISRWEILQSLVVGGNLWTRLAVFFRNFIVDYSD